MLDSVKVAVETGKLKLIEGIVREAMDGGLRAEEILASMVSSMDTIGDKFQRSEIFIPEMMAAALTMKKGVAVLKPALTADSSGKLGKFIIGTAAGDMHDIGKNLVALMVESAGFEVIDLGVDVSADRFIAAISENPDRSIVGISTLLTTTMAAMRATVEAVHAAGLKDRVKIMVGGAPITPDFALEIGADAYAPDAGSAAAKAKEFSLTTN